MGNPLLKLITADSDVGSLNLFDSKEQAVKDKIHERLNSRCEYDARTGCWVYTGCWSPAGQGLIRVGQRKYKLPHVSAWLYMSGFHLEDERYAYRRCDTPACFNPNHLLIAENRQECQLRLRLMGRWGHGIRKLNQRIADSVRIAYADKLAGRLAFVKQQAKDLGVLPAAINRIVDGISWVNERRVAA